MVETKTLSSNGEPAAQASTATAAVHTPHTFGAGYIAPHPSIRKDAVDVDAFLQDHQVYTQEYLASVRPVHRNPSKWYEFVAWYWHVLARTMIGLLTGTLGNVDSLTEHSLAMRILFFCSAGTVCEAAAATFNHVWSVLRNRPDNGWVHTGLANSEAVRTHGGIWALFTGPPLPARLFQLWLQAMLYGQYLLVYCLLPSVVHAYEAYRAEEQVFNYSQAIALIDSSRFKRWRASRAPAMAASYYALQEGAQLRDALLRMRADEACICHLNAVLADLRPGDRNPFVTIERKAK